MSLRAMTLMILKKLSTSKHKENTMQILNLTQHTPTPEQIEAGVVELTAEHKVKLCSLLSFNEIPTRSDIYKRANAIAELAMHYNCRKAMIGGALWLMGELEKSLLLCPDNIQPVYAFSQRVTHELHHADGTVTKTNVFKHVGFIEV